MKAACEGESLWRQTFGSNLGDNFVYKVTH